MTIPVIALRGLTVLPNMVVHFDISRKKSIEAAEYAMENGQRLFLVTQRDLDTENPEKKDLYPVGMIVRLKQMSKTPSNVVRLLVETEKRAELVALYTELPYLEAEVAEKSLEDMDNELDVLTQEAFLGVLKDDLRGLGLENLQLGKQVIPQLLKIRKLSDLLYEIGGILPLEYDIKQGFLEQESWQQLFGYAREVVVHEQEISRIKSQFQQKVKERVDKSQKEYFLREQMRVIREELGEDNVGSDAEQYMEQLCALEAGDDVKQKIEKEIRRFKGIPGGSQEGTVIRNYIETLLELPWDKTTEENKSIRHAETILNADHYGLTQVKERVLEQLAVRCLTERGDAPIICLVGPPGTGKTSIAQSVAKAMNKKYIRISLGGVRDEAEIRGHRKTYVGAMPGRIVSGLRQAGVSNPLMLLDEIDKVSSDYKGDTSSALLEVLDGEQNCRFRDHYVELPVDLSRVLFIATANSTQTIPGPLLDRMEVIEVNSYTENEKYHIAKNYLVSKQKEKNGLKGSQLTISGKALEKIIHNYTREAGVRNLERNIGAICRKAAKELLETQKKSVKVTDTNLQKYLGKEKVRFEDKNETDEVGVVRGLAWTQVGGDTLEIEVAFMPGTGKAQLTGKMGEVMKESAQIAISYIRSISPAYEIAPDFFDTHDIHLHIPEGAVPKDGPSAGITMATAILSAAAERKVKADLAMTGEVTLRGRVLPIGGLKEKLLAAKMAKISHVLVPEQNRTDVEELSDEITGGMEITFVSSMEEVIGEAFV